MEPGQSGRGRLVASVVVLVGVAVLSFLVGRSTASGDSAHDVPSACAAGSLAKAGLPDGFDGTVGYFSLCEKQAAAQANGLGEPFPPIKMYGDPEGTVVIGMWYGDCGYPEGLVHPDQGRPSCVGGGTTAPFRRTVAIRVLPELREPSRTRASEHARSRAERVSQIGASLRRVAQATSR